VRTGGIGIGDTARRRHRGWFGTGGCSFCSRRRAIGDELVCEQFNLVVKGVVQVYLSDFGPAPFTHPSGYAVFVSGRTRLVVWARCVAALGLLHVLMVAAIRGLGCRGQDGPGLGRENRFTNVVRADDHDHSRCVDDGGLPELA
jgi:hypothetical protein